MMDKELRAGRFGWNRSWYADTKSQLNSLAANSALLDNSADEENRAALGEGSNRPGKRIHKIGTRNCPVAHLRSQKVLYCAW